MTKNRWLPLAVFIALAALLAAGVAGTANAATVNSTFQAKIVITESCAFSSATSATRASASARARSTRMDVALPITASAPRARMPRGVKRRLPGPVNSTGPMRRSVRGCMGTIAIGEIRSRCYAFPYGKDTAFSIPLVNEVLPCLFNTANTVNTASMANTVNRVARVGRAL